MRFLADQDVYGTTIRFLTGLGHDVLPIALLGLSEADDAELLRIANVQGRILISRDRDFGGLVFVQGGGRGVLYLRMMPATQNAVHAELERVLTAYSEQQLNNSFVVVELGRHRIRKLDSGSTP